MPQEHTTYRYSRRNKAEIKDGRGLIHLDGLGHGLKVMVDRDDLVPAIMHGRWHYNRNKDLVEGHQKVSKSTIKLGRFLVSRTQDIPPGYAVKHKDGNGLNCHRDNLYIAPAGRW